jgi:acetoacetyl-CoA reductase
MSCLGERVAIVTGSSRGLGRAIAQEFARHGCKVVVNFRSRCREARELVDELRAQGCEAVAIQADVSRQEDVERLVETALQHFGRIDVLVNNAGVCRDRTLRRMSPEEWREVLSNDLDSVFLCTWAVVPHMIEQGGGRIINISSIIGQMGNVGQCNYAAAKAGIIGFTKAAALELARYNITVNVVCPGFVETDMVTCLPEHVRQRLLERIPMARFGRPEEVARLCRFLAAEGDYITGAQLNINGGMYV